MKESVTTGNWPWRLMVSAPAWVFQLAKALSGMALVAGEVGVLVVGPEPRAVELPEPPEEEVKAGPPEEVETLPAALVEEPGVI